MSCRGEEGVDLSCWHREGSVQNHFAWLQPMPQTKRMGFAESIRVLCMFYHESMDAEVISCMYIYSV